MGKEGIENTGVPFGCGMGWPEEKDRRDRFQQRTDGILVEKIVPPDEGLGKNHRQRYRAARRSLHRHPELGREEHWH